MNGLEMPEAPADVIDTAPSYLIYNRQNGIFLGIVEGCQLWSKVMKVGMPPSAPTWASETKAVNFAADQLHCGCEAREVVADTEFEGRPHATPEACRAAGLDAWEYDEEKWKD